MDKTFWKDFLCWLDGENTTVGKIIAARDRAYEERRHARRLKDYGLVSEINRMIRLVNDPSLKGEACEKEPSFSERSSEHR